jgi:hypothetical protein
MRRYLIPRDPHTSNATLELAMEKYKYHNGGVPCGTVACALGHGPAAGILFDNNTHGWTAYSLNFLPSTVIDEWAWLFAAEWSKFDNTPLGAAKRIRTLLESGVPEGFCIGSRYYFDIGLYS